MEIREFVGKVFLIAALLLCGSICSADDKTFSTTDDPRLIRVPPQVSADSQVLVLSGATVITGTGKRIEGGRVVTKGNRIVAVGSEGEVVIPSGERRIIDVTGQYVVPGLIDLHIHLAQYWNVDDSKFGDSDSAATIRGTKKLISLLDGGITAVRDVGTRNDVAFRLKEAVDRNILEGPRVFIAGKGIMARGGHGDEIRSGVSESSKGTIHSGGPYARIANGADDWRLAVREQIRENVDLIKLFAPFTQAEVISAIDEAHMQGYRVAVDAYDKYIPWAARAGADSIEHTLAMSEEALLSMSQNGVSLVPTLTTYQALLRGDYASAGLPPGGYFNDRHRNYEIDHQENLDLVAKAHKMGIDIGIGTDIGFAGKRYYPDVYFYEMENLSKAGLSNQEIFSSATRVGAKILGMQDKLGTLEAGKLADILVVGGDPFEDFRYLKELVYVIADGVVVRGEET